MSDLISRQVAIDTIDVGAELLRRVLDDMDVVGTEREKYSWGLGLIESNIKDLEDLPSVNRPQGEWKGYNEKKEDWLRTDGTPIFLVCDQCYGTVLNNGSAHWNFCPNCGARMKGADDETD